MIREFLIRLLGGTPQLLEEERKARAEVTERNRLWSLVQGNDTCPECGNHGFLEGPCGGASMNIFCANRECRAGFNVGPFGIIERIGKGDINRFPKVA